MNPRLLLCFIGLLICFSAAQAQTTLFVSTTGTNSDPASATSWATSTTNLQGAIDAAPTNGQVWIAGGLYKPTTTTGPDSRTVSFAMKNGVAIYGGFGGNETAVNQRPSITLTQPSSTTLSGDIGVLGMNADNSLHVIANPALGNSAVLDGVVITEGNADGGFGGGMYPMAPGSNPTVCNCHFIGNMATYGGAMSLFQGSPALINCYFLNNRTYTAGSGGALLSTDSNPVLTNCSFERNLATIKGGGVVLTNSNATLINCRFVSNTALISGGGLFNETNSTPTLINCSFSGNKEYAVTNENASAILKNCILWGNTPNQVFNSGVGVATLTNSIIDQNGYAGTNGNLRQAPLFTNQATSDLTLANCSPAINAGNNAAYTSANGTATDLGGQPRFVNGSIDMGAYEFQATPSLSSVTSLTSVTPDGLAVQLSGGTSYERLTLLDRINGYEIRGSEVNTTGYFLIRQAGPYSITVIGPGSCRTVVTGTAP